MTSLFLLYSFLFVLRTVAKSSGNLTISFSPLTQPTCDGPDVAITFTTSFIPSQHQCFNLDDLFSTASSTYGSRTGSSPYSSQNFTSITWNALNAGAFDASANYSRIFYQQQNVTQPQEGKDAARSLEVFSGRDCVQTDSSAGSLIPILGWSCQSSVNGSCYQAAYGIESFTVVSAQQVNGASGKCWVASTGGARGSIGRSSVLGLMSGVLILVAALL